MALRTKPSRSFPNFNGVMALRKHVRMDPVAVPQDGLTPQIQEALPGGNKAVHVGTIPGGAVVLRSAVYVRTAVNGTTPAVELGTEADPDGLVTAADSAVGTVGVKDGLTGGALMGFTESDLEVFIRLSSTDSTAGEFDVVVEFYCQKD